MVLLHGQPSAYYVLMSTDRGSSANFSGAGAKREAQEARRKVIFPSTAPEGTLVKMMLRNEDFKKYSTYLEILP